MATKKKSKAGAAPERVRRNPERTRARILEAARVEFARPAEPAAVPTSA